MRPGDAFGESGLDRRNTAGLFAADVSRLHLDGISIHWQAVGYAGGVPAYYGAALELHDCTDALVREVIGNAAHPKQPAAVFDAVSFADEIRPNQ